MCGIFGYIGKETAASSSLIKGLEMLEYRGYDSAGIFIPGHGVCKAVGEVKHLTEKLPAYAIGTSGIAHTRWATHGVPNELNCHPHTDCTGTFRIVHNGIIENAHTLSDELTRRGHTFRSSTDSEIIAHLLEGSSAPSLAGAVAEAMERIQGTYGVLASRADDPDTLVAARNGSPLVLGIGENASYIASDPSAILPYTREVIYLADGEMATVTPDGYEVITRTQETVTKTPETIAWDIEDVQKGGYPHFMLKEIMEAPEVVRNAIRGRLLSDTGEVKLGGLEDAAEELGRIDRIIIIGCGSAYYAGCIGEYMLEEYAGIPVEVELGSEFRYRTPVINDRTAVIAISQSGETADTRAALAEAQKRGAYTIGVVNVVGSSIARETHAGVYTHAGPEISVASTKAFISQLAVLVLLTIYLGRRHGLSQEEGRRIIRELEAIPDMLTTILSRHEAIADAANAYADATNMLYIGRKYATPLAQEGALKVKEIAYVHAEGYSAGEMKHGPLAMITDDFPTFAIALRDSVYAKNIANIEEIRTRGGPVIALGTDGDTDLAARVDHMLSIPPISEILSALVAVVPLQLFAYEVGVARGYNVDKPRNLAKSVTVE